jgi:carotenoid 1,2-hydratase
VRPWFDSLPVAPGAYRWYYVDFSSPELSAVAIFMLGSPFSARYVPRAGNVLAARFASVNLAVYRSTRRLAWVFSEFDAAHASADGLRIGNSSLRWEDGRGEVEIDERSVLFGRRVQARIRFFHAPLPVTPFPLPGASRHLWQPIAPRAEAILEFDGQAMTGRVYHDTNVGEIPLTGSIAGWSWSRTHGAELTSIRYATDLGELHVRTDGRRLMSRWQGAVSEGTQGTRWGLRLPKEVPGGSPKLLESSPFYARFCAEDGDLQTLGEVTRFEALRKPWNRWMARSRLRVEGRG